MEHLLARDFFAQASLADLASVFFDLSDVSAQALIFLLDRELTVKDAAALLGRDRSTAQRALHALVKKGLATRNLVRTGRGGAKFVYRAIPRSVLRDKMVRAVNSWSEEAVDKIKKALQPE